MYVKTTVEKDADGETWVTLETFISRNFGTAHGADAKREAIRAVQKMLEGELRDLPPGGEGGAEDWLVRKDKAEYRRLMAASGL